VDAAALDTLLKQSRAYNQEHDITGVLLHTPEGRFLQVLESPRAAMRHLYYYAILSDMRHHHCQVLGEGSWPKRSFATWTMGFRQAQSHDLRTLLGEAAPDDLGLILRPYPRPQLLGLVLDFMKNRRIPSWQEQKPTPTEQRCNGLDVHHPSVGRKSTRPEKRSRNLC